MTKRFYKLKIGAEFFDGSVKWIKIGCFTAKFASSNGEYTRRYYPWNIVNLNKECGCKNHCICDVIEILDSLKD